MIEACIAEDEKLYLCVSSPTIKDKPVQIRPWKLSDADFVLDASMPLDPRKTVFVGGVPRPLKAIELAMIMDRLYGGVCYAGIDTDPELKYPKVRLTLEERRIEKNNISLVFLWEYFRELDVLHSPINRVTLQRFPHDLYNCSTVILTNGSK